MSRNRYLKSCIIRIVEKLPEKAAQRKLNTLGTNKVHALMYYSSVTNIMDNNKEASQQEVTSHGQSDILAQIQCHIIFSVICTVYISVSACVLMMRLDNLAL